MVQPPGWRRTALLSRPDGSGDPSYFVWSINTDATQRVCRVLDLRLGHLALDGDLEPRFERRQPSAAVADRLDAQQAVLLEAETHVHLLQVARQVGNAGLAERDTGFRVGRIAQQDGQHQRLGPRPNLVR